MKIALQTVVETGFFERNADKLLDEEQRAALIDLIAANPTVGEVIRGTGGIRIVRMALRGGGKRGGARVIYFYHDPDMPIFLLSIFAKSDQENLSKDQRNQLSKLAQGIARTYGR